MNVTKVIIFIGLVFGFSWITAAQALGAEGSGAVFLASGGLAQRSTTSFSVINIGGKGDRKAKTCANVKVRLIVLGTRGGDRLAATTASATPTEISTDEFVLLDARPFELSPGQVMPVAVMQPFVGEQTLLTALSVAPKHRQCLIQTEALVRDPDGKALGFVGSNTPLAGRYFLDENFGGEDPPACYPCAPVCACGHEGE